MVEEEVVVGGREGKVGEKVEARGDGCGGTGAGGRGGGCVWGRTKAEEEKEKEEEGDMMEVDGGAATAAMVDVQGEGGECGAGRSAVGNRRGTPA